MTQYHQKKIAMINDLSGYGRCSITAALPVLAALKIQCCPVPTSVLSNHTGFPVYFFDDYTDKMEPYIEKWKELGLSFDGIVSGFLGSERQIQIVKDMITEFKKPETKVIVDPIMGDHGETYATYTETMCRKMRELAEMADILTPNLTEACILTERPFKKEGWSRKEIEGLQKNFLLWSIWRCDHRCERRTVSGQCSSGKGKENNLYPPQKGRYRTSRYR